MATWQETGIDNFRVGRELMNGKYYRSSISRFYYVAFSLLTAGTRRTQDSNEIH